MEQLHLSQLADSPTSPADASENPAEPVGEQLGFDS